VGQENIADAIYWFRKAAEQGHKDAIDRLAELGIQ
jgi:TPR repeat protein